MQYNAKTPYTVETHWQIEEVLDGDSIIICHRFTGLQKEIRLYGLDAPEGAFTKLAGLKVRTTKSAVSLSTP